jgi:hypothetical protein
MTVESWPVAIGFWRPPKPFAPFIVPIDALLVNGLKLDPSAFKEGPERSSFFPRPESAFASSDTSFANGSSF